MSVKFSVLTSCFFLMKILLDLTIRTKILLANEICFQEPPQ